MNRVTKLSGSERNFFIKSKFQVGFKVPTLVGYCDKVQAGLACRRCAPRICSIIHFMFDF